MILLGGNMPISPVFDRSPSLPKGQMGDFTRISILADPQVLGKLLSIGGSRLSQGNNGKHDQSTMIRESMIIYAGLLDSLGTVDYEVVLQAVKEAIRKKDE